MEQGIQTPIPFPFKVHLCGNENSQKKPLIQEVQFLHVISLYFFALEERNKKPSNKGDKGKTIGRQEM